MEDYNFIGEFKPLKVESAELLTEEQRINWHEI